MLRMPLWRASSRTQRAIPDRPRPGKPELPPAPRLPPSRPRPMTKPTAVTQTPPQALFAAGGNDRNSVRDAAGNPSQAAAQIQIAGGKSARPANNKASANPPPPASPQVAPMPSDDADAPIVPGAASSGNTSESGAASSAATQTSAPDPASAGKVAADKPVQTAANGAPAAAQDIAPAAIGKSPVPDFAQTLASDNNGGGKPSHVSASAAAPQPQPNAAPATAPAAAPANAPPQNMMAVNVAGGNLQTGAMAA